LSVALILAAGAVWFVTAEQPTPRERRERLMKTFQAGNFKDAYEGLRQLALDPADDPLKVGNDLTTAVQCLNNLGRMEEIDAFAEAVIGVHQKNWRLLDTAAGVYADANHFGYLIAGKFSRGYHRGGGRYVNSFQRDR